jgi:hypothetical protein
MTETLQGSPERITLKRINQLEGDKKNGRVHLFRYLCDEGY